ncbi:MAG: DUF4340 domain-containing protein [Proteobacteria bacterium]|nr:DUF4340 domain-containing protein [Pseudomonadota bacterium]MBU1585436.1 DUF4340 domain-containing protein [Pseudomonadota bacterium]MBU2454677.1 DUF4340 domain-containing protein [Pseudomonadota bacterium]MBU2628525.1 DUF4340 domain-containing protein [Pseudomonadota bacterium]
MKKEYLILIALILIFSAYLLLHKESKDHYTLPVIEKIDVSKITGLVIAKKENTIEFTKKGQNWILTDKGYPADLPSLENMLDTIKTFKLSALVSQKEDLKRYELDDENRIQVNILVNAKPIFKFTMGKTAPTFNHTFIMLTDNKNIYHANGSFRSHFDKSLEDFRDKKVLEIKKEDVKQFTIEKDGLSSTLISKEDKTDKQASAITWQSETGTPADKEIVSTLLSSVSFLECEKYLDTPSKKDLEIQPPLCSIRLGNDGKTKLMLFKTDKEETLSGISSMNDYAFVLNQFNGKEIVSTIDTLLGIPKKEEKTD